MSDGANPAWTTRLRDVFGASFAELRHEHMNGLVQAGVKEDADLDFKGTLYGRSEADGRELCKDIAAMRNGRGGVIVLGVGDKEGIAVACPGVALSDGEERRMRQVVASGTAPHAAFDVHVVPGTAGDRGFYLLIAQPSPFRPHAVVMGNGFRYPRRDGSTTRYLSEVEVADMYRDRFRGEREQVDRLDRIGAEARDRVAKDGTWLVVSLVPNSPGGLPISFKGRAEIEQWARTQHCRDDYIDRFFPTTASAGVGLERYTLATIYDAGQRAGHAYAECHVDGAAAAALVLHRQGAEASGVTVFGTDLVWRTAQALRLIGNHAVRAGAYGDAAVNLQLLGESMYLGFFRDGYPTQFRDTGLSISRAASRHTVPIQSLVGEPQELLAAVRVMLQGIFNAFGRAEVPHLTDDGALRLVYFHDPQLAAWAANRGVQTTLEQPSE